MDSTAPVPGSAVELRNETLELEGLDCPDCAASLEKAIAGMSGVANARLNYTSSTLWVEYSPGLVGRDRIAASVREAGYGVRRPALEEGEGREGAGAFWRRHPRGAATAISGVLVAAGRLLGILAAADRLRSESRGALAELPYAIDLSRRTVRTIRQNVALSVAVKLAFVLLASMGIANLWMAVLADMGTSLAVIGNGMMLLRQK